MIMMEQICLNENGSSADQRITRSEFVFRVQSIRVICISQVALNQLKSSPVD